MRKHPAIVGTVAVGMAAALAVLGWVAIQHWPAPPAPPEGDTRLTHKPAQGFDDLSPEDNVALRAIVSEHMIATANCAPGRADPYDPFKAYRVLVLPRGVSEIYKQKPLGTLRTLRRIIEAGPSADAHAAIAYAHAAVGYANDDPVPLIHACSYAYYPTAKEFEDVNPVIPKTYRQFAVEAIKRLIVEAEKKPSEKNAAPK